MRDLAAKLLRMDRRVIFVLIALATLIPLLRPIGFPIRISPEVQRIYDHIESLPPRSVFLLSLDFDPASKPELYPMAVALLNHAFRRDLRVIGMTLWVTGTGMAEKAVSGIAGEHGKQRGIDYTFLGYSPGGTNVIINMGQDLAATFPTDHYGERTADLPVMRGINSLRQVDYVVSLAAGTPGVESWYVYGKEKYGFELGGGVTAVIAPGLYPLPRYRADQRSDRRVARGGRVRNVGRAGMGRRWPEWMRNRPRILSSSASFCCAISSISSRPVRDSGPQRVPPGRPLMPTSVLIGVWVAAGLTLCMFSFLYKDNPFFRFGEHLYVGISMGYTIVRIYYDVMVKSLYTPVTQEGKWWFLIAAVLGLLVLTRFIPKVSWLSRISFAVIVGFGSGVAIPRIISSNILQQVQGTLKPLLGNAGQSLFGMPQFNALLILIGVVSVLVYFFFPLNTKVRSMASQGSASISS
ncbi:MAG: hypothetical protein M5R38_06445 [Candidatus Methylomirabilis sp.]|nr:hypothetical protein [Candidatus Methylomirabilis sp.]